MDFGDGDDTYEVGDGIRMSPICPEGLLPGTYKLRILKDGFDLVRMGGEFLSSQCGPAACFHSEEEEAWSASFISRGFGIRTEVRDDLAPGSWDPETSWKLSLEEGCGDRLTSPVFLISL